jgi:hypothetical protein
MPPSPWELPEIAFILAFVVPAGILVANIFFKRFVLGRGIELVGADLALCGFSVLLTQTLRAVHNVRLPPDLIVVTILVLLGILLLWAITGLLVKNPAYSLLALLASWGLGGLVFYACIRYWAFVQALGYTWG